MTRIALARSRRTSISDDRLPRQPGRPPTARPGGAGRRSRAERPSAACAATRSSPSAPGQLAELAPRPPPEARRLLVVVGGDGTVNEVVNGIAGLERRRARGRPPRHGRRLRAHVRHPARPRAGARRRARRQRRATIDLGRATFRTWAGDEATTWFANIASAGMSGAIAKRANETSKALGGKVATPGAPSPCSPAGGTRGDGLRRRRDAQRARCTT